MASNRKTQVRFRERAELLDFLLEVSSVTGETLDLDRLLANVSEIVQDVIPYDLFAILLYNERSRSLRMRYAIGHRDEVHSVRRKRIIDAINRNLPGRRSAMTTRCVRNHAQGVDAIPERSPCA